MENCRVCKVCKVHEEYDEKYNAILKGQGAVDSGLECLQHCSAEEKVQLRAVEKEELKKVQQVEGNSKKDLEKAGVGKVVDEIDIVVTQADDFVKEDDTQILTQEK